MRLKIISFLLPLSVILFTSCERPVDRFYATMDDNTEIISVPESHDDFTAIDSIISSYRVIPLEPKENVVLGEVTGMKRCRDHFIIWDSHRTKAVVSYSTDGKFERRIGRMGRGPGEYVEPYHVTVADSLIVILDGWGNKLVLFNEEGVCQNEIAFDLSISEIEYLPFSDLFLCYAGYNRNDSLAHKELLVLDRNAQVVRTFFKNKFLMNYGDNNISLSSMNDELLYHKSLRQNIVTFDSGMKPLVKYHLDFGRNTLPNHFEKDCSGDFSKFMDRFMGSYSYFDGLFWEQDRFVGFSYVDKGDYKHPCICIFDKMDKKSYSFDNRTYYVEDSLVVGTYLKSALLSPLCFHDGKAYCYTTAPRYHLSDNSTSDSPAIVEIEFRK